LEGLSEEALASEHALLANAQEILTLGQAVETALTDDENGAFARIVEARRQLDAMARLTDEAKPWQSEPETLAASLQALNTSRQRRLQAIDVDPARLQWVEERVSLVHKLKRKYGATLADILRFLADARTRLQDLSTRAERLVALDRELKQAEQALRK